MDPRKMYVGAVFQDPEVTSAEHGVTGLSYHRSGKYLVSANGTHLRMIDALSGVSKKQMKCYKYGIGCICYTHDEHSVLHGGQPELRSHHGGLSHVKESDGLAIRYLSMYDNKYLRSFRGHEKPVSCLAMNPKNDTFYSAGQDDKVAVWDLASPRGAVAVIDVNAQLGLKDPSIDVDSKGMVFSMIATSGGSHTSDSLGYILQFDSRNYEAGPFANIAIKKSHILSAVAQNTKKKSYAWTPEVRQSLVDRLSRAHFTGIESSRDGNYLLVKTDCAAHLVYDAFDGFPLAVLYDDDATFSSGKGARLAFDSSAPSLGNDFSSMANTVNPGGGEFFDPPSPCDAAFAPGGDYVIGGGDDGLLRIWKLPAFPSPALKTMPAVVLTSPQTTLEAHIASLRHLRFNPAFAQAASACANTCLWLSPAFAAATGGKAS